MTNYCKTLILLLLLILCTHFFLIPNPIINRVQAFVTGGCYQKRNKNLSTRLAIILDCVIGEYFGQVKANHSMDASILYTDIVHVY